MANKNKSKKRKEYLKREKELNKTRKKIRNLSKQSYDEMQKILAYDIKGYEKILLFNKKNLVNKGHNQGAKFKDDINTRDIDILKKELTALKDFTREKDVKTGYGKIVKKANPYRSLESYKAYKANIKRKKIAILSKNINIEFQDGIELDAVIDYLDAKGKEFEVYYEGKGIVEVRDKLKEDYQIENLKLVTLIREYFECKDFENNEIYHLQVDVMRNGKDIQALIKKLGGVIPNA